MPDYNSEKGIESEEELDGMIDDEKFDDVDELSPSTDGGDSSTE